MAKIPCEIIRDLLPLYKDDICSEKSRNAIEEHIKECESCRTYLKKMEGEIPVETDKIEGTDEEWKGFREFSEKVSRKLNGRIVMACGVVFLICMMLTVALYSDAFQSYHLSKVAYVIPFEDGQIITDNGTKASEFDYVGRSGEKKILWQENDEVKKAPARVEKFVKESLEKEEDDPADENAVKVLWVNPQMPLQ